MKFDKILDTIFESKTRVRILRLMSTLPEASRYSGNQIAKLLNISPSTASLLLNDFVYQNIMEKQVAGHTHYYSFNLKNYIVQEIILKIFSKEEQLLKEAGDFIKTKLKTQPESLILYGSVARKQEKSESDYDLFVVVKNNKLKEIIEKEIFSFSDEFYMKFGKPLMAYILSVSELKTRYKEKTGVIKEIMRDGILLQGKSLSRILKKEIKNDISKNRL